MNDIFMIEEFYYIVRIIIAAILGFIVGFERKMRYKEAGIRTHAIVAIGSCLMMLISKYGFRDVEGGDTERIAAQVVSGIGFLGAGMILYKREALRGLTTAAGIWTTAGIGMCVGAGLFVLSLGATLIVVLIQVLLHRRIKFFTSKIYYVFNVNFRCVDGANEKVKTLFATNKILKIRMTNVGGQITANYTINTPQPLYDYQIVEIMRDNDFIISVDRMETD